jgi:hypothetical protein
MADMTSFKKQQHLEHLERLSELPLSESFQSFSEAQLEEVNSLVEEILEKERAGLDRFFESMSQTLKFIPNFIILAITTKYIEPPVAARITVKLPLKNSVAIAKGLSVEYISETAIYMDDEYAASLLTKLPNSQLVNILNKLYEAHPLRILDIFVHMDKKYFFISKPPVSFLQMDTEHLSDTRTEVLEAFQH